MPVFTSTAIQPITLSQTCSHLLLKMRMNFSTHRAIMWHITRNFPLRWYLARRCQQIKKKCRLHSVRITSSRNSLRWKIHWKYFFACLAQEKEVKIKEQTTSFLTSFYLTYDGIYRWTSPPPQFHLKMRFRRKQFKILASWHKQYMYRFKWRPKVKESKIF